VSLNSVPFSAGHALMVRHWSALALDQIKAYRLASTCHHGFATMLKHLIERCTQSLRPLPCRDPCELSSTLRDASRA